MFVFPKMTRYLFYCVEYVVINISLLVNRKIICIIIIVFEEQVFK